MLYLPEIDYKMNKPIVVTLSGIIALLLLQGFWLNNSYTKYVNEYTQSINNIFSTSIEKELSLRQLGPYNNKKEPGFIVRRADSMTPEERAKLKGDTIILGDVGKKGVGKSYSDVLTQFMQDKLLVIKPVQLLSLDSILKEELAKKKMETTCQLFYYDRQQTVIDSFGAPIDQNRKIITTDLNPVGTKGLYYLRAVVPVSPSHILQNMLYSLIISFLIVIIVFACLYYQLVVIRRARQQLEEREAAVHGAIHDLKSPLHTVVTLLDGLAYKEKNPEQQLRLEKGNEKIMRLCETIESIQDVSRMEAMVKPNKEKVDLVALIEEVRSEMDEHYADKKHTFSVDNQLSQSVIRVNKSILERCLRNLMDNALKYADEGVVLTVTLSAQQGNVQIAIRDTGWGIPKKAQKKLFTQFYRTRPADKPAREGYGIGLSSVKQLIGKIEGVITFVSKEGTGSTFFINLPTE